MLLERPVEEKVRISGSVTRFAVPTCARLDLSPWLPFKLSGEDGASVLSPVALFFALSNQGTSEKPRYFISFPPCSLCPLWFLNNLNQPQRAQSSQSRLFQRYLSGLCVLRGCSKKEKREPQRAPLRLLELTS